MVCSLQGLNNESRIKSGRAEAIMDALDDKHQFQLQKRGRGGWSREALTSVRRFRDGTLKEECKGDYPQSAVSLLDFLQ